jgi:hypothetical protein
MSDTVMNPAGPWDPGREMLNLSGSLEGRGNAGWGTIETARQALSASVHATAYNLKSQSTTHDFYSVFGHFQHGVAHGDPPQDYDPSRNWASVGYYADKMSLTLELLGDDSSAMLWDSGPTSTVTSESVGFNIGGNLSAGSFAGEPILSAGVSGGFGAQFSSPSVKFAHSPVGHNVTWFVSLPGVGHVSPGVPANPFPPSYAGYKWYFGAIYVLTAGKPFSVRIRPSVEWGLDWTRGIRNDTKAWQPQDSQTVYTYKGSQS